MTDGLHSIRLSKQEKDLLVTLKRRTGIKNWNTLCRLALCVSLSEETAPPPVRLSSDSNVEMTWQTFAGPHASIYSALLRQETVGGDATADGLHTALRRHIHRGLNHLAGLKWNGVQGLITALDDTVIRPVVNR